MSGSCSALPLQWSTLHREGSHTTLHCLYICIISFRYSNINLPTNLNIKQKSTLPVVTQNRMLNIWWHHNIETSKVSINYIILACIVYVPPLLQIQNLAKVSQKRKWLFLLPWREPSDVLRNGWDCSWVSYWATRSSWSIGGSSRTRGPPFSIHTSSSQVKLQSFWK